MGRVDALPHRTPRTEQAGTRARCSHARLGCRNRSTPLMAGLRSASSHPHADVDVVVVIASLVGSIKHLYAVSAGINHELAVTPICTSEKRGYLSGGPSISGVGLVPFDRSQASERVWLRWWSEPLLPLERLREKSGHRADVRSLPLGSQGLAHHPRRRREAQVHPQRRFPSSAHRHRMPQEVCESSLVLSSEFDRLVVGLGDRLDDLLAVDLDTIILPES